MKQLEAFFKDQRKNELNWRLGTNGVKRKLVFFESLVELPLEVGDTILYVGLMASEYGGRIMWNAYANTCMILKVGDDLESLRLHFSN